MSTARDILEWEGGVIDAPPPPQTSDAWMFTFADLVSLMLTFFVLLFSMTSMQAERWQDVVNALSRSLSAGGEAPVAGSALKNVEHVDKRPATSLTYLSGLFETVIADTPQMRGASVALNGDRLVVSLPSERLFAPDGMSLSIAAKPVISAFGGILDGLSNRIAVAAHTGPMAEGGKAYASNWELSLARAAVVANALAAAGVEQDIRIEGMADSRFGDLPDLPPAERLAMARRVDIVILAERRRAP